MTLYDSVYPAAFIGVYTSYTGDQSHVLVSHVVLVFTEFLRTLRVIKGTTKTETDNSLLSWPY